MQIAFVVCLIAAAIIFFALSMGKPSAASEEKVGEPESENSGADHEHDHDESHGHHHKESKGHKAGRIALGLVIVFLVILPVIVNVFRMFGYGGFPKFLIGLSLVLVTLNGRHWWDICKTPDPKHHDHPLLDGVHHAAIWIVLGINMFLWAFATDYDRLAATAVRERSTLHWISQPAGGDSFLIESLADNGQTLIVRSSDLATQNPHYLGHTNWAGARFQDKDGKTKIRGTYDVSAEDAAQTGPVHGTFVLEKVGDYTYTGYQTFTVKVGDKDEERRCDVTFKRVVGY